jgi:hypothetical protein
MAELARARSFGGNSYPGYLEKTWTAKRSGERTFILECLVNLPHVTQRRFPFERETPVLDVLEYVRFDSVVQSGDLEDGNEVVDELSGGYFSQEVVTPVLDAYVCELGANEGRVSRSGRGTHAKSEDLDVGVLVVETALEGAHGVLCGGRL